MSIITPSIALTEARNTPSVQFSGVGMRYGTGPEVLHDVSFQLHEGSFHFITGPSGAGKSSLLKLIYLAEQQSRGLVSIFGHDTAMLPVKSLPKIRRRIGVVFQNFRLIDHLPVFDNVALPLRVSGKSYSKYKDDVNDLLKWVGLGKSVNAFPRQLSGGEKQRAAIARAVISKPDLLIADEPTGNVDPEMARRLIRLFAELNRLGTTVLIASHDFSLVHSIDAPVLEIANGKLI